MSEKITAEEASKIIADEMDERARAFNQYIIDGKEKFNCILLAVPTIRNGIIVADIEIKPN